MNKAAAERYPAKDFKPPEALKRVRVCAFSNELATDGCEAAGTAYTIDLPASRVPTLTCTEHSGNALTPDGPTIAPGQPLPPPDQPEQNPQKEGFPKRFMRSFHKLFGG